MKSHWKIAALVMGLALSTGAFTAKAYAQGPYYAPPYADRYYDQGHYDHGYRDGMEAGDKDARKGIRPIPTEHGRFRDSHNPAYRDGYVRGYRDAYERTEHWMREHYRDRYNRGW